MEALQEARLHRQHHIHTGYIVLGIRDSLFEMAVACIKHFEGWHNMKDYVGYGHQLQKGERYSARTLTKKQGDLLLRFDLMRNLYLFRNYGKDALLLSVLAYNVGSYRILGTKKIPKSRLLRKIERGDRNIYNGYIAFCRWHGRQVKSIKFLPCKRPKGRAP